MTSLPRIRERLPTLYRPEEEDEGPYADLLRAAAATLDATESAAGEVLRAHWFAQADRARYSPYLNLARSEAGLGAPDPAEPADLQQLERFPYLHDLARLGALFDVAPLLEPFDQRDLVETYRERLARVVALARGGLGTVAALRRMLEIQLPVDLTAPVPERDRAVRVEELAPLVVNVQQAVAVGLPSGLVGPLMRFGFDNDGLRPAPPTVLIESLVDAAGTSATERPVIELLQSPAGGRPVGLAYRGTVPPGQALRLRPSHSAWLALEAGLRRSLALPAGPQPADPSAPGPFAVVDGAPVVPVGALLQTRDGMLWAAATTELWRFDGGAWSMALDVAAPIRCLAEDGLDLLIGADSGLLRAARFPEGGAAMAAAAVPGVAAGVNAVRRVAGGDWWVGTDDGLVRLDPSGAAMPVLLAGSMVHAIADDREGSILLGGTFGLIAHQPSRGHWYLYTGEGTSEEQDDWRRLDPEVAPPDDGEVFLPPVLAVRRGPDASLWIGTERGVARYLARPAEGLTFRTALQAFPDLGTGVVWAIDEDERGSLWMATAGGLLRADGRDWWQLRGETWVRLGRVEPEGGGEIPDWRFHRASGAWQRTEPGRNVWQPHAESTVTTPEPSVRAVLWTDGVVAEIGTWDGTLRDPVPVDPADLEMRFKPREDRIERGGIPAVPRLPPGPSTWRYLALEPQPVAEPASRPAWTVEGRLLPPPDLPAPWPGRYDQETPPEHGGYDEAVYAFEPAARVRLEWAPRRPLGLVARLGRRFPGERIHPAVLERVWAGVQQARPAGSQVRLMVDDEIVRGESDGTG